MASLLSLPPELTTRIIHELHPSAHLNFAVSCKYIFECSKDVLKTHRKVHDQYTVCSDVSPITIPNLVRQVLSDPPSIAAWYIRTLELYWERQCWAEWETCPFTIQKGTRDGDVGWGADSALTHHEQTILLHVLRERFYFSEHDLDKAAEDLKQGSDAPLKFLVVALCPRLTTVKYSRDYQVSGRQAFDCEEQTARHKPRSSVDYIQRAIILHRDSVPWPAGLSSLRHLAIGIGTKTELDEFNYESPLHLLVDIIKLPTLNSLYLRDLSENAGNEALDRNAVPYNIAENSSSIEHIFIDCAILDNASKFRDTLSSAPRSLKSLAISDSEANNVDRWLSVASETLMLYQPRDLRGSTSNLYSPDQVIDASKTLKTIVVDPEDFFLDEWDYRAPANFDFRKWAGPFQSFMERYKEEPFLPSSIETLVLGTPQHGLTEEQADLIDDAFAAMIASRSVYHRHSPKGTPKHSNHFPNLKAIYLGAAEDERVQAPEGYADPNPRRRVWFRNTIRAGRNAGIDIHTRTTRGQHVHKTNFPTPPNPAELKFVPDSARDFGLVTFEFDVCKGQWQRPSCGNCGRCTACWRKYDVAVWEELDRAPTG